MSSPKGCQVRVPSDVEQIAVFIPALSIELGLGTDRTANLPFRKSDR